MTDRIAVGQHLVTGFEGTEVPDSLRRAVREDKIGNFILISRNVASREQLTRLCAELQELALAETGHPAFITIDQEGGMVSRLPADASLIPSAMSVAATGKPDNAYQAGLLTGRELRAMGVNFNLAPVVDVLSNRLNPVIGERSYGDDPARVAAFAAEMARGLTDGGVLSAYKHFPGHGDTAVDSHVGLPCVDKSLDELMRCELVPYIEGVRRGVPAVMTTHILFPQLESGNVPATMSRAIITGLLKQKLGFAGLVISDCMMMGAIAQNYGTVPGVRKAVGAGVDLVFVSHDAALAGEACREVARALAAGELAESEFAASTEKLLRLKAALPSPDAADAALVGCAQHRATVARIAREAVAAVDTRPFALGDSPIFIGCLPVRSVQVADPERCPVNFPRAMRERFGGESVVTSAEPDGSEIRAAVAQCEGHSAAVVCTCQGHRHPAQIALAKAVGAALPTCCVAMAAPYELSELPMRSYAAFGYDLPALSAVGDVLAGAPATGVLPVKL